MKKNTLLMFALLALLLVGCGGEDLTSKPNTMKESVNEVATKVVKEEQKQKEIPIVSEEKVVENKLKDDIPIINTNNIIKNREETTKKQVSEISKQVRGETLYKKCAACHGVNGDKAAFNISLKLNAMKSEDIVIAIKEYRDGKIRGTMSGLMSDRVRTLSNDDIEKISTFIGK